MLMKSRILDLSIFLLSTFCFIVSAKLMYNMGIYVDEHNTTPGIVSGGDFWLYMTWLKMGFSALISVLSAINLFSRNKKTS